MCVGGGVGGGGGRERFAAIMNPGGGGGLQVGRRGCSPARTTGRQLASRKTRREGGRLSPSACKENGRFGRGYEKGRGAGFVCFRSWVLVKATQMWEMMRACVAEREGRG